MNTWEKFKAFADPGSISMEPDADGGYVHIKFTCNGIPGTAQFSCDSEGLYALTFFDPEPFLDLCLTTNAMPLARGGRS